VAICPHHQAFGNDFDCMENQMTSRQDPPHHPHDMSSRLSQMIIGYRISQALYVAAKLGIADLLHEGPKSREDLAAAAGVNPDALYRVLRALASVGVFTEVEPGRFGLTPLAALLQTGVPGSLRALAIVMGEEPAWRPWGELLYSVHTGLPAFEHVFGMPLFAYLSQHPDVAHTYQVAMAEGTVLTAQAVVEAYDFSGIRTVLDVGGGQGALIAAILKAHPHMHGMLLDLPHVIPGAKRVMETEALAARCALIEGDFFAAVPSGADAYLLKWILHDWDDARAVTILTNCRRAMPEQGKLLVVESVLPAGNEPSLGKFADLHMLVRLGGRERTEAEYRTLFAAAGLRLTHTLLTPSPEWLSVSVIEGVCA
jgi:ubiquinone/menaquinone biosynthesis C-methylase UbiE